MKVVKMAYIGLVICGGPGNGPSPRSEEAFTDRFGIRAALIGICIAFDFGINYKACGFCKFAGRHGDQEILPHICGLDFEAYATSGIRLERTQTLAGGASHCNFRFSRLKPE